MDFDLIYVKTETLASTTVNVKRELQLSLVLQVALSTKYDAESVTPMVPGTIRGGTLFPGLGYRQRLPFITPVIPVRMTPITMGTLVSLVDLPVVPTPPTAHPPALER